MSHDSEYVVIRTEDEIETEQCLLIRHQRYELQSGLVETHAIDPSVALRQRAGENRRVARDPIDKCRPPGIEDLLAIGAQVIADARESQIGASGNRGEDRQPDQ
jgi:hypothetical protein